MIAVAICDNNQDFSRDFAVSLERGFHRRNVSCLVETFATGSSLLSVLEQRYFDLICLDIVIGEESGVEVGNIIRDKLKNQRSQIIYVSNHRSFHQSGRLYDSSPMAYIQKPVHPSDVDRIISKTISRVLGPQVKDDFFTFSFNRVEYRLLKREIMYIESQKRTKLIYATGDRKLQLNANMKKIIAALDSPDFVLIHCSYLVNLRFIEMLSSSEVRLSTGKKLPVSEGSFKAALLAMGKYQIRQEEEELRYV